MSIHTKRNKFTIEVLVNKMLDAFPDSVWESSTTKFLDPAMGGGQFLKEIVHKLTKAGHSPQNIKQRVYGYENNRFSIRDAKFKLGNTVTIERKDFINEKIDMKFDIIIGNPPYQEVKNGQKKTSVIWHKFVIKAFDLCKEDGIVALIHPPQWRNPEGETKKANQLLFSKQIKYLSCHGYDDGRKTFGAGTNYDWYVVENRKATEPTTVRFQDGVVEKVDLTNTNFIPSGKYNELKNILATNDDEKIDFVYSRSAYGNDKKHMSKTQEGEFKYPCVYTVTKNEINFYYSSTNNNGHFGVPKVIWSNGSQTRPIIDEKGDYGVMNFAYGIADTPENLPHIVKALNSDKMREIMSYNLFTEGKYSANIIKMFKKDFWKEFI